MNETIILDPRDPTQTISAANFDKLAKMIAERLLDRKDEFEEALIEAFTPVATESPKQVAYAIVPLYNDPALIALQNELKVMAGDYYDWVDPSEFHLTLCYSDNVFDVPMLAASLPASIQSFPLHIETTGYFDNREYTKGDSACLHAAVVPSMELVALQSSLLAIFKMFGEVSEYSEMYVPHITMGYLKEGKPFLVPAWKGDVFAEARNIELSGEVAGGFITLYQSKAVERHVTADYFKLWKGENGRYQWCGISSVNAMDRDGEIISEKALEQDVKRTKMLGDFSTLRFFHIQKDIGESPYYRAVVAGHLIEMGEFSEDEVAVQTAEFIRENPDIKSKGWGMSIGFRGIPDEKGVFDQIWIHERSILPLADAANPFTRFEVTGA
jgi:2'-5' RNA ligase